MCGFSGALFLSQLQSWKQLDAYNYFHCSYVRTILWENDCCMLCWSPVMSHTCQYPQPLAFWFTRIPVQLCVSTLHSSSRHSISLASLNLAKTLSAACIVPNTLLANQMPFRASTINDYWRLTPVATPPEKGLFEIGIDIFIIMINVPVKAWSGNHVKIFISQSWSQLSTQFILHQIPSLG